MRRRCIGLDVHREFAQVAIWEDGRVRHAGQVEICGESLRGQPQAVLQLDQVVARRDERVLHSA